MKIRPVGAELLRAVGRTDMTKLIVAFRNFANAPKYVCWRYTVGQTCEFDVPTENGTEFSTYRSQSSRCVPSESLLTLE